MDQRIVATTDGRGRRHDVMAPPPARVIDAVMAELGRPREVGDCRDRCVETRPDLVVTDRALERLTPDRVQEIRHRLAVGAYASPAVRNEMALRLLESGDL